MVFPLRTTAVRSLLALFAAASARAAEPDVTGFFESKVEPILKAHCWSCHGAEKPKGKLNLTSRDTLLKKRENGLTFNAENPGDSLLLKALAAADGISQMPPKGKLPQAQIDVLAKWVKMGVPFGSSATTEPKRHGPPQVDDAARNFWSFKPVVRPAVPAVKDAAWVKSPIDAFILARLEAAGFKPAKPADKAALLRRVTYDLTGLPPAPADVDAFLADQSPDAYEKVVDRLLASRHYGEHMARKWLDLVRYAETNSFERDGNKPNVWKYRDYVIRAFNEDKPYGQFIREQLAGDEIEPRTRDGLIATGYYRLGIWDDEPADRELSHYEQLDDIVSTTGQTFLGLTVGCARCHDHKIDPFPQKDYYKLVAFFHGVTDYTNDGVLRPIADPKAPIEPEPKDLREKKKKLDEALVAFEKKMADLNGRITAVEDLVGPKLPGGERDDFKYEANRRGILEKHVGKLIEPAEFERYTQLLKQREELTKARPAALEMALAVSERNATPRDTFVLTRGNPHVNGEKVTPGFPLVLTSVVPEIPKPAPGARTAGRRKVLADWIADGKNPLTARVMVNRIWQGHFGRGIVRSSSNFGYMGTPPTHPALLDWLAGEFVAGGMKVKPLHKLILMSSAYRMSSAGDPAAVAKDPENDLLSRFDLRRLSAEEIRDSILAVCGNINLKKTEGPSIKPPMPQEVLDGSSQPKNVWRDPSGPEEAAGRSVFIHIKRSLALPQLSVFDTPDPDAPCPVRFTTTQPTQALVMLNGKFLNDQAKVFAESLAKEASDPAGRVRAALRRTTQRNPTPAEIERGVKFLAEMEAKDKLKPEEALRRFCLMTLNLNEFVYLD